MTPEELLRSLKSNDEWTLNSLTPRANPFADAVDIRTPSRARIIALEFAAVAAVIALIAGVIGVQNVWRSQLADPEPLPVPVVSQTPSPTPPPVPDPTPTPPVATNEPEPPPPSKPALEELTLSTRGLGELRLGAPVPEQDETAGIVRDDPDGCAKLGKTMVGEAWVPRYSTAAFEIFNDYPSVKSGDILAINVRSPRISTTKGIHIGSTKEDLYEAYDNVFVLSEGALETYYAVKDDWGMLVFTIPVPGNEQYFEGDVPVENEIYLMQSRVVESEYSDGLLRIGPCSD